jgi:very-short-patch-repair endonuclease
VPAHEPRHHIHPALRARARALRRRQTAAEGRLWQSLRGQQLHAYKFRRQHSVGRFICDFYRAVARLVVAVDGEAHATQAEYDAERTIIV